MKTNCIEAAALAVVATVHDTVPAGVDEAALRKRLLAEYNIEVGAGLGALKGKIIRVGLMGQTSRRENVDKFLAAFRTITER